MEIVDVYQLARADVRARDADDFAIASNGRARLHRATCDLVAGWNVLPKDDLDAWCLHHGAGREIAFGDQHVIGLVNEDRVLANFHEILDLASTTMLANRRARVIRARNESTRQVV